MEFQTVSAIEVWVDVTADDIQNGYPSDCDYCPVALAVGRALNHTWTGHQFSNVQVEAETGFGRVKAYVETDGYWFDGLSGPLPKPARRFVLRFDSEREVSPFSFRLRLEG